MLKKLLLKKVLLAIIAISAIGFIVYYFWQNTYRFRASTVKATLNFLADSVEFQQGETKDINFTLTTEKKISAVDLYFKFNLNNNDLLEFVNATASAVIDGKVVNYFDDVINKYATSSASCSCEILRFTAVAKKPDDQLVGSINFRLTFKAKKKTGSSSVSFHASIGNIQNQVVGITGVSDNLFDLKVERDATNYTVNRNAICSHQSSNCGSNAGCINGSCSCNSGYYNCDGNWENGCESSSACVASPTLTPTTTSSGAITLNLKLKFQGIMDQPRNENQKTMKVKIKVGGGNLSQPISTEGDFRITNMRNKDTEPFIWEGTFNLPSQVTPGSNYYILVKGPKHIQKRICDQNPNETSVGTYRCFAGKITFQEGTNTFDFSKIYLLVGDLPVNGAQDGVIDALDISYIRNNLGKTDPQVIAIADLNLDGIVDTQDYSGVIAALSIKTDEE